MAIHIDFETRSAVNLLTAGAFKYARNPSTDILIVCWAEEDDDVLTWTPGHRGMNEDTLDALLEAARDGGTFIAHNAQFEYAIWNYVGVRKYGWPRTKPEQWRCTAARAAAASLPRSLEKACLAMGLKNQKDKRGSELIKVFCMPQKTGSWIYPNERFEDFTDFVTYCQRDVLAERELDQTLPPLSPTWQRVFTLDLEVNERGIQIDVLLARKALLLCRDLEAEVTARVNQLTGVNPTQVEKFKAFLNSINPEDPALPNLQAKTLKKVLKTDISPLMRELVELRMEGSRASLKKFASMIACADSDGRARGTMLFNGAHTGRWTGRLIQPHNFVRGLLSLREQATVLKLLQMRDAENFKLLYDNPLGTISQVLRTFIVARAGHRLLVVDYSAIETRILFWLAGDTEALDQYRAGVDLYVWMAARLYGIPESEVAQEQRRIGKNLILGCGYGLGYLKFVEHCDKEGVVITVEFSKLAVRTYRDNKPKVVSLWRKINDAALAAAQDKTVTKAAGIYFDGRKSDFFVIRLPSGRKLYYPQPEVRLVRKVFVDEHGNKTVREQNQLTYLEEFQGGFIRSSTYGGKLVENIVQAIAADILAAGMESVRSAGYLIALTVHDEIVSENPVEQGSIEEYTRLACVLPPWIGDCPIAAKGFETLRYRKD